MTKRIYNPALVNRIEIQTDSLILIGSTTDEVITTPSTSVSVVSFEDDNSFDDGGFGDITF